MFVSEKSPSSTAPAFLALACVGAILSPVGAASAGEGIDSAGAAAAGEGGGAILVSGRYAQPDVASAKSTASLLDTPQTITVINNITLQRQNLLTLRDVLSTLPGITFGAGEGGGGFGDSINLRGYSANTDITVDGVRDSAQYSRTETFDLQQIEVYNGANSVFNGSGSVGGTINLVQKLPQAKSLTVVSPSIGTDDYYRATLDSNIRVNELIAFRLNAVFHRNDVPGRDVERFKRWGVAPAVTFGIDSPTRFTLMYLYQHDDNVPQYGVPYFAAAGGKPDGVPYDAYYGYRNIDKQKQTINQLTAIFEQDVSDHVSIRNLTRYENIRQLTIVDPPQAGGYALNGQCIGATPANTGIRKAAADGSCTFNIAASGQPSVNVTVPQGYYLPGGPRGNLRDTRNQIGYDQLDLRANFATGPVQHEVVLGAAATWEHYNLDTGRIFLNADGSNPFAVTGLPLINIADPSHVVPGLAGHVYGSNAYTGPVNYTRSNRSVGDHENYATYLFDTSKIGEHFEVNFGVRWEHSTGDFTAFNYSTTPGAGFGAVSSTIPQHNAENLFSYRVGGVFKPTKAVSLYVAYGNSRTPSITTVNGGCTAGTFGSATFANFCDVQPEEAKNYEIGAKADLLHHRLQLTAALFRNERSNFRVASNDPSLGNVAIQVPDGRSRVDGLALGASGNITRAWTIFANYTYLKSKVLQGAPQRCVDNPADTGCAALIASAPEAGGPIQQTPRHSGSLFTTYMLPFGLQLGYGLTYQGSFAIVTDPGHKINGHYPKSQDWLTQRLFASYPVTPRLTGQVNIQNFANEHYYTSIRNNGWAVPGALRSATFSLFYNF
ncbi:MAG TPA: TonB-dependent receptor [Sphingomonas sp.]|nr:TonB-dependent receptor [Sphingomonas sp.]